MSEYQRVVFRAIDGPVSAKNLEYMEQQSSRAEFSAWSFDNEYHYGDFRGNALEMLRRGYDFHLHFADFGTRDLYFRLPGGFPDTKAAQAYLGEGLRFDKDKNGPGGSLVIEPFHEAGELDGMIDIDEFVDRLLPLRGELMNGDLRPLYLMHLAVSLDGNHDPAETTEAPVPAGLKKLSSAQEALADFYCISAALIGAAAEESPPLPAQGDVQALYTAWLQSQPTATKDAWLAQCLADPQGNPRRAMLAEFHKGQATPSWPTVSAGRTMAQLLAAAEVVQKGMDKKAAEAAARQKAKKRAALAADPSAALKEARTLVGQRGTSAYEQAADLLAELREALAGTAKSNLAELEAWKLKQENPTLKSLTGALRRKGFVPK